MIFSCPALSPAETTKYEFSMCVMTYVVRRFKQ